MPAEERRTSVEQVVDGHAPSGQGGLRVGNIASAEEVGCITPLDTGDFYGMGQNELLIGRALRDRRDKALLSVKFGALRSPDGGWVGVDTSPPMSSIPSPTFRSSTRW